MAKKRERQKKQVKNKVPSKRWTKYTVKEGKVERKMSCPRCGLPIFLGEHKNRLYCGKCHFTEFKKK